MEHLPKVEDPAYDIPFVPFLGHIVTYDRGGFKTFPDRQGWEVYAPRDPELSWVRHLQLGPRNADPALETSENIAAFVQAWLYFGVLDEVFNVILELDVPLDDFKQEVDGNTGLSTSHLRRHIDAWETKQHMIDADHYTGRRSMEASHFHTLQSRVYEILVEVQNFFYHYIASWEDYAWTRCLTIDLQKAILILADTLKAAGMGIWTEWQPDMGQGPLTVVGFRESREILQDKKGNYSAKPHTSIDELPLGQLRFRGGKYRHLLKDKFLEHGWCPNECKMLYELFDGDTAALFVASRLRRPFSSEVLSHRSCTADCCLANQVEDGTYESKHTALCLNPTICRSIGISSDVIAQTIEQGRLPLISIEFDRAPFLQRDQHHYKNYVDHGRLHVHIPVKLTCTETENYVAISHVWSHGLGNPRSNTLPECQLARLRDVAHLVPKTGKTDTFDFAVWIDTLCIPVDRRYHGTRKKAIGTISEVFRKARYVVVLDADLQRTSPSVDRAELCTRILLSGWMRRLWTLNEAVISGDSPDCQRLLIMFANGPIAFNWIFKKGISDNYHSNEAVKSLILRLPQASGRANILTSLTRALQYRSTSWPEDEAICLAGLLGLDVKRVLQFDTAPQRMFVIYSMLTEVLFEWVFHDAPRLNIPGRRWAPISLLTYKRSGFGNLRSLNMRTATVNARGVLLDNLTAYFIRDVQPNRYRGSLEQGSRTDYYKKYPERPSHLCMLHLSLDLNVVTDSGEPDVDILKIYRPAVLSDGTRGRWMLVSVVNEEAGVLYCDFRRLVTVGDTEKYISDKQIWWGSDGGRWSVTCVPAPSDKTWCIG